jgi:hypothetical protein
VWTISRTFGDASNNKLPSLVVCCWGLEMSTFTCQGSRVAPSTFAEICASQNLRLLMITWSSLFSLPTST